MDMLPLQAQARDPNAKPKQLRRTGKVPCVVYGTIDQNMVIQCDEKVLHKTYQKAGGSTIVELDVGGKKVPVLFKHITFDPITDREMHVDFYAVNMKQEIEAPVPVHFEGESLAIKDHGGIFVVGHSSVRVRCLPSDLPHSLTMNISRMVSLHDIVSAKDLVVPKGVQVLDAPETVIATIQEPRAEEVVVAPTAEATAAATAEGAAAAGAEGAAPAAAGAPAEAGKDAKAGGKDKK